MELSRHLNPNRTLRAIQSPGLIEADAAEVAIEEMATLYIAEMQKMQPQGPYFLGGWCFGGAIAYEISRQLRQMGQQVTGIVMIDTRAPIQRMCLKMPTMPCFCLGSPVIWLHLMAKVDDPSAIFA